MQKCTLSFSQIQLFEASNIVQHPGAGVGNDAPSSRLLIFPIQSGNPS
jgi:hypothetical protein